jgi:hypothetical protein
MKASFLFTAVLLVLTNAINGQTNDRIKRESDNNRQERSHSPSYSDNGGDGGGDDLTSALASGCAEGCIQVGCTFLPQIIGGIITGLSNASDNIQARETEVPRINSVELGFNAGFVNPNSTLIMPTFKWRGGLFSTSLRVFSNTEKHFDEKNNYTTVNWQIIQFNLAVEKEINIQLGTGILYETYSDEIFQEFGFGMEILPGKFYIPVEFRFTPDYVTGKTVLFEAQTGLGYTARQWRNAALRIQANYTYGNYYEAVNLHGISLGINFLFDTGKSRVGKEEVTE